MLLRARFFDKKGRQTRGMTSAAVPQASGGRIPDRLPWWREVNPVLQRGGREPAKKSRGPMTAALQLACIASGHGRNGTRFAAYLTYLRNGASQ